MRKAVGVNRKLLGDLVAAADRNWTGAFLARDKKTGSEASIYLYEGGIYSVELDDYEPSSTRAASTQ